MGPDRETFGTALRQLRASSGLTQEELADRAGLSANAISALERGERTHPYPHTVRALASALDLTAEDRRKLHAAARPRQRERHAELPSLPGQLIGREQDVADLTELLTSGTTRMLTLTGPAGVGKTRLAQEVAGQVAAAFTDGVTFVSLAPLPDPGLVVRAVAHALGVRETGSGPLEKSVHGYLRNRNLLLFLDNFEHLRVAAAAVAGLLAAAPQLSVLVTSRSPLRIRWEHVFPVAPLSSAWAEQLFCERSLQAAPGVRVDDADVVSAICQRLDCLPLAIELAAARTALLPPRALLARLGQAMEILTSGASDLPDRQQTLRHALTWSYDLLGREEQALFRHLSVFAGSWTLDAAAEVARVDDASAIQFHAALLDNSLIVRKAQAGEPRFGMLHTVWSYAAERLTAGEEEHAARDRHAVCYRDLALVAGAQSWGPEQAGWLDRLEDEKDNLRLAVLRLLGNQHLESFASVAFALWPFWWIRGHHAEALGWVDRALEHRSLASARDRARLLFAAASLRIAAGRNEEVAAQLDESIRLAREAVDQHTLGFALTQRGFAAVFMGQPALADRLLAEAETVSRSHGDPYAEAMAAVAQAHTLIALGQASAADALLAAREEGIRALGAEWTLAVALNTRGRAALVTGSAAASEAPLREAAAICGRLRDTWAIRYTLTHLADAAALQGDPVRAAVLYGAADLLSEKNVSAFPILRELTDRCRATAAQQLGADAFAHLCQQGRALQLDEAIALATGQTG